MWMVRIYLFPSVHILMISLFFVYCILTLLNYCNSTEQAPGHAVCVIYTKHLNMRFYTERSQLGFEPGPARCGRRVLTTTQPAGVIPVSMLYPTVTTNRYQAEPEQVRLNLKEPSGHFLESFQKVI